MNIILKKAMLVSILVCSMMLFAFGGCGLEREYYDDIIISLEAKPNPFAKKFCFWTARWYFLQDTVWSSKTKR